MAEIYIEAEEMKKLEKFIRTEVTEAIETNIKLNLTTPIPYENRPYTTTITDTGEILRSIEVKHGEAESIINLSAPHTSYIEYGTAPHTPPIEPLISWAKRKLKKGEKDAVRIAYSIQAKISKEGSGIHPFIRPAIVKLNR